MCGIIAANFHSSHINQALQSINNRGPDAQMIVLHDDQSWIGHTLLAIHSNSVSASIQPLTNNQYTVGLNGEIYNYQELRHILEGAGYNFDSTSDAEVILHGLHYWGLNVFGKLDGEYAIVCYSKYERKWWCVTDRWGTKPLKYYWQNGKWAVASTAAALQCLEIDLELDVDSVLYTLTHSVAPYGRTVFRNIMFLPPNSILRIDDSGIHVEHTVQSYQPTVYDKDVLHELLINSVKKRVPKHYSTALALSGGVDSSTIALLLRDHIDYQAYSIRFPNSDWDESSDAIKFCQRHDISLEVIDITQQDNLDAIVDSVRNCETIVLNAHCASKLILNKRIPNRVVFTGDGGDEQFYGYQHLYQREFAYDDHSRNTALAWSELMDANYNNQLVEYTKKRISIARSGASGLEVYKNTWLHQYGLHILGDSQSASVAQEHRYPFLDYDLDNYLGGLGNPLEINKPGKKLLRTILGVDDSITASYPKRPFIAPPLDRSWWNLIDKYILDNIALHNIGLLDVISVRQYCLRLLTENIPNRKIISQLLSLGILAKEMCHG